MNETLQLLIEHFSQSVGSDFALFSSQSSQVKLESVNCRCTFSPTDQFDPSLINNLSKTESVVDTLWKRGNETFFVVFFKSPTGQYDLMFCKHSESSNAENWKISCKNWVESNCRFFDSILISLMRKPSSSPSGPSSGSSTERFSSLLDQITSLFEAQLLKRVTTKRVEDCWSVRGREKFQANLNYFVSRNWPIPFVLPAFPFKSSNKVSKVIGDSPDMGEKVALLRLESFLKSVGEVYSPGAFLTIFSDGRVYCDLCKIPDSTVTEFREAIRNLINSELISWSDLDLFFSDLNDNDKREALVNLFGTSQEAILHRVRTDPDFHEIYCGFKRFMQEELAVPPSWSGKKVDREMATVAKKMMLRNYSYGNLVKILFPHHIRLSIHPSNNTTKFSVNLISHSTWGTPWHNCALLHPNGCWSLIRRKEAEETGCQLTMSSEGLAYYKLLS